MSEKEWECEANKELSKVIGTGRKKQNNQDNQDMVLITPTSIKIVEVTSDNLNEVVDDFKLPKDETGLREFIEDCKRHHRRGH